MKKSANKKSVGKQRNNPRVIETPGRSLSGIPNSLQVTLSYCDTFELAPSGAPYAQWTFRGNSLFDPDYTSTGHQPMYFDTYAALYNKYKVLSSTCQLTCLNASISDGCIAVLLPHSEVLTLTSFPLAAEAPYAKVTRLIALGGRYSEGLFSGVSTSTVLGLKKRQIEDEDYSASVGANPSSVWYWNIGAFSSSQSYDVQAVFSVKLTYTAVFYDRKTSGLSYVSDPEIDHVKIPKPTPRGVAPTFSMTLPKPLAKAPPK